MVKCDETQLWHWKKGPSWWNAALTLKEKPFLNVTYSYAFAINHDFKDCKWKIGLVTFPHAHILQPDAHTSTLYLPYASHRNDSHSLFKHSHYHIHIHTVTAKWSGLDHCLQEIYRPPFSHHAPSAVSSIFPPQGNLNQRINFSNLWIETCMIVFV